MRVGLIGYARSGKTTLLDAVSAGHRHGDLAAVPVPDARFERLCEAVHAKKRTPAGVEISDNAARMPEGGRGSFTGFAEAARQMDALIHVVREFDAPHVAFHAGPDPGRDHMSVETELVLADLQLIENRLERLARSPESRSPGHPEYAERALFERLKPGLERGSPVRRTELTEDEQSDIAHHQLLTAKPLIIALNCSEDSIHEESDFEKTLKSQGEQVFRLCALAEAEIARLEPDERPAFLGELGITTPLSERLVRAVFDALGLITFFTTNEHETKAWPLRKGSTALKAAHAVHSDIAKGFIRAEVVHFSDFERLGDLRACYSQGLMRLEGKEYAVQDGDIIRIRHKT